MVDVQAHLENNGPHGGIGEDGVALFIGGVRWWMVCRRYGVIMGNIIYFRNPLIKAVRLVVLFARNWVLFASGEGWKVYLAEDALTWLVVNKATDRI